MTQQNASFHSPQILFFYGVKRQLIFYMILNKFQSVIIHLFERSKQICIILYYIAINLLITHVGLYDWNIRENNETNKKTVKFS